MNTVPSWEAAANGLPGNLNATNQAAQLAQLLGTHAMTAIYEGTQILTAAPASTGSFPALVWVNPQTVTGGVGYLPEYDVAQPFTMPAGQTAIGRIKAALLPVGDGADLQVSLCADAFGSPGAVLASTIVPKEQLTALAAPAGLTAAGPLAAAADNILQAGLFTARAWTGAATSAGGLLSSASAAYSGNYLALIGGTDSSSSATLPTVYTVQLTTDGPGPAVAQPSLPQGLVAAGVAATSDTLIVAGGWTGTAFSAAVYTATWNSNTGTVSAWSSQAALPHAVQSCPTAVWNNTTVFVLGGRDSSNVYADVYAGTLSNGTVTAWNVSQPLPVPLYGAITAVIGNLLIVAGGFPTIGGSAVSTTYWAQINPDGSLSAWQTGPTMPQAIGNVDPGITLVTDSGLYIMGGNPADTPGSFSPSLQSLTATADGLGTWQQQILGNNATISLITGGFSNGDGSYTLTAFSLGSGPFSNTATVDTVPYPSIPLPASGLTPGATYHLVFHQIGGDLDNNLQVGEITTTATQWLYSTRYSGGPWTGHANHAILFQIYDQTATGDLLHVWQDPGSSNLAAATVTQVFNSRGLLLGVCESTLQLDTALNSNPTFTTGTAPWTAVFGTLTQSSAKTHGGYAFSGLLTPAGGQFEAYAVTEQCPISPGQWVTADGWVYSPTGWGAVSLSVVWHDSTGAVLSQTDNKINVVANAWVELTNTFQAPAGAAFAALAAAELNNPAASNLLYLSNVRLTAADPVPLPSVAQVTYDASGWPPTGVTQLA